MSLILTYNADTTVPVEIEGFTPAWARDRSLDEIRRFEVYHGNRRTPLGELFNIDGSAADLQFDFHGDLSGVHWIGAHMREGEILVHGSAGRHIGSEMVGGKISVEGDVGGWAGAEMHGGLIHISGSAEHLVGAAYRGSAKGMTGGTILVEGNVGNEVGLTMRRGLIAVGGNAGDLLGFNMIAGTVLVFGGCGIRVGAGMRRGTLGLLGPNPPAMLPSFRHACCIRPPALPLLLGELRSNGFPVDQFQVAEECDVYNGDLVALGKGEIWISNGQC